jgi:alkaline phosphatase D
MRAPGRTMLGAAQKRWLFEGLAQSQATWNILAQQVIFAPFDIDPGPGERYSMDKWDGYPEERDAILRFLGEQRAANPKFSPVVLTGDNHNHWAFSLEDRGRRVGFEFAGTSISSGGDGADINEEYGGAVQANPHLLFHSGRRGYLRCFVDPREWRTEYVTLDFVSKPGAQASVAAQIALEAASLRHSNS